MDDNGQNQMFSGSLSFGLVVLAGVAFFAVYHFGHKLHQNFMDKGAAVVAVAEESTFTVYDKSTVKGSQVISLIDQWIDEPVFVNVKLAGGGELSQLTYDGHDGDETPGNADNSQWVSAEYKDPTNALYINPNGNFKVTVSRNSSDTIIGVTFEQVSRNRQNNNTP